ncbi:MAG: RagB/SusD family nutrient uptake outer membrane protein [Prevotellaceae bacterium]|jgi:hypothetical protein|nr:RagB/SusD family nutrient uptake outer membrane protein [Prevotellaceae bacterium]
MKTIKYRIIGIICLMLAASCSDLLEEQPRSSLTPDFFRTEQGIVGGLTAVYSHLRYFYGPIGGLYVGTNGTDECTWAVAADGGGREIDSYDINPTMGTLANVWNRSFTYINTCNGIISIGAENNMPASLLAEAKFFRAHDYFMLVQTYGGAPLDLGAGRLAFNTSPVRVSVRSSEQEVYEAIFQDLTEAVAELPDAGRVTGGATKTAARFFLAKAYLTYGWWLERNGKTDPAGKSPAQYYQLAYNTAIEAIRNPASFGLMPTFYDVNLAANDRNKEIVLYADHTDTDAQFNEGGLTDTNGPESGMKENRSNLAITCNFEQATGGVEFNVIRRIAQQDLGRPWSRIMPTAGALLNTFRDKTYDSRYDGTFVTTYYANFDLAEPDVASKQGANGLTILPGEAAWKFFDDDTELNNLVPGASDGFSLPGRAYAAWTPSAINRTRYPGLWKFGPDRADKTRNGPWNAPSTRPFPIAKFSEFYFIAAEAAVKGATVQSGFSAKELINVIRARAGVWRWDNNGRTAKTEDYSADMTAATPANVTIDYILMERSRELFAEGGRWFDLTRTGKLQQYAAEYYVCENGQAVATKHTRNIQPHHYLRPIPEGQLNGMEMSDAEKKAYQNPGYN